MFVLLLAGLGVVYNQTATVRITVPAQRVEAHLQFDLASTTMLSVSNLVVQVTESAQGAASPVTAAPAYATGTVRLRYVCRAPLEHCSPTPVPAGTIVKTSSGVGFRTLATATFASANLQQYVPVRALNAGSAGNQAPGSIQVIEGQPLVTPLNTEATTGGVDGGTVQVVQQSDLDAVRAMLVTKVTDELASAMAVKAKGMTYFAAGDPVLNVTTDHSVGDVASSFTLTMTGKLGARGFSNVDAQRVLRSAMQANLRPGYAVEGQVKPAFALAPGTTLVSADAAADAVPRFSRSILSTDLAGLGYADALAVLQRDFPGSRTDIRTSPVPTPWLPLVGERIKVTVAVQSPSN